MIEGLGAALSALSAQTQRMDALANDTANMKGTLESSSVDFADTAVGMIETRASYAAAIGALHVQDEMWSALLEMRDGSGRR
jgi:flagellar basal body rod protein FlgG